MSDFLVVDDSKALRLAIVDILEKSGHKVVGEAQNGIEAYEKYKELKPDAVTMDIIMPELNGIEATKNIINDFPNATIIMVSSVYQKGMVVEALKDGARDYIVKPIQEERIIPVVEKVLSSDNNKEKSKTEIESSKNFDMKMLKGAYVLYFYDDFNKNDFNEFNNTVEFLKEVENIKIIFDFGTADKFNEGVFEFLINIMEQMLENHKVSIFSENSKMIDKLKKRGLGKLLFKLS